MADFDLTQTDAQVQSILNDAQDAQGAGAQTTLTTDYIMLKGTNGRYHKILKDSFTEAVRNVLGGLLVNNDKGTTISQIAAIASGDFGSITPANLASVLGAAYITKGSGTDFNSITDIGKYFVSADSVQLTNMPPTGRPATRGVLIVESKSTSGAFYANQVYKEMAYESQIWTRKKDGETWSPWVRVDNFGCATASDLASLLGVVQRTGQNITIGANDSYNVPSSGSVNEMCGLWEIYESTNYGAKMIVNIAYNASGSTYPGVDIISSPDGMNRGISVTKENGFNSFTINNLTNGSLTLRIRRI